MKKAVKAQLGTENMMMAIAFFFVLVFLGYLAFSTLMNNYIDNQISSALTAIKNTADSVHELGMGNKETVRIDLPKNLKNVTIEGNYITITSPNGKIYDKKFNYRVIGILPTKEGTYSIPITSVAGDTIKIGAGPFIDYLTEKCLGKRKSIPTIMFGYGFEDAEVFLTEPWIHGGTTIPYPESHHTILGTQQIDMIVDVYVNFTNTTNRIFWGHPPSDPYLFYVEQNTTGLQSNTVPFYIISNCSLA